MEDQIRHTVVTSQNGCLKAWTESRGTHGMEKIGRPYDVQHGRLIITPDGTAKDEAQKYHATEMAFDRLVPGI